MRPFRPFSSAALILFAALALAGCATTQPESPPAPAPVPTLPPSFPPQDLVGRYGYAAYHKPEDQARIEDAARAQCRNPYVIAPGPTGGVMMHIADQAQPEELRVKGAPGGKNFIGPEGPPGGMQDREVERFDGRVLVLRSVDPEVLNRYGTEVYVRCGAEGTKPPPRKRAARPRPPAAKPMSAPAR